MSAGVKDMNSLFEVMEENGFQVVPHGKTGTMKKVTAPDGAMTFMTTSGPSNGHKLSNARAWANSHGLPKPGGASAKAAKAAPKPTAPKVAAKKAPVPTPPPAPVVTFTPPVVQVTAIPAGLDTPTDIGEALPPGHPAFPAGLAFPLGDGVWLEPVRVVTPELAEEFLKWNKENRSAAQRVVAGYSRDIADGAFYEKQGDPVRFAVTGKLLDGQQRLQGVVDSGKPVQFVVITGLPESSQDTMDNGRRRTVADQLRINGFVNPMVLGSAARVLWLWEHGALVSSTPSPTNSELLAYVTEHCGSEAPSLEVSVTAVQAAKSVVRSASVAAALHYKQSRADIAAADAFWAAIATGADLRYAELDKLEGSPVLALRNTLFRRREIKETLTQGELAYLIAKAWQLWREGTAQTKLYLPRTGVEMKHFPEIS